MATRFNETRVRSLLHNAKFVISASFLKTVHRSYAIKEHMNTILLAHYWSVVATGIPCKDGPERQWKTQRVSRSLCWEWNKKAEVTHKSVCAILTRNLHLIKTSIIPRFYNASVVKVVLILTKDVGFIAVASFSQAKMGH